MVSGGMKRPKDDKIIIEELQVANCHLRKMVDSLFYELSNCQQENFELKARVRLLEEQLAVATAAPNNDELAIVARHREEVRSRLNKNPYPSPSFIQKI